MKIVLMADVVGSSQRNAKALMESFKAAVMLANRTHKSEILSPLTITLGDEFQGVVKDTMAAVKIIIMLEEYFLTLKKPIKLRYVVNEGAIDTKLNQQKAYEMLGPGLTEARQHLLSMKTSKLRFNVTLKNQSLAESLQLMFILFQGIVDRWTPAQQKVVAAFLELHDYRAVAERLKKDATTVWRRRRSLLIEEYNSLKRLMFKTIDPRWQA